MSGNIRGGENPSESPENGSNFGLEWDNSDRYGQEKTYFQEFVDMINQFRFNCGMFVNNNHVQFIIVILISVNAIMMGIGTYSFVRDDEQLNYAFEIVDLVFLIIFTVELGLQFFYHGWRLLLDGWLNFDLIIIVTSWSFSQVQIIRAFRIFRALRLVTRIKIMKNLILALFGVVPRMAAIGLMLGLIFYIFAVMFTQLFNDLHEVDPPTEFNYFGSMGWTLFTLFQMMTLDNWASICREVMVTYNWAWLPFTTFVIISGFIVVNLIIAVICDAIASLHKDDKAKLHGDYEAESESEQSAPIEIREQLDCLEEQMEELTRIQARTFHTLQYLTRQMQMSKLKKDITNPQTRQSNLKDAAMDLRRATEELATKERTSKI